MTSRARASSRWRRRKSTGSALADSCQLVHEALDREDVVVRAQRPQRGNPQRHGRNEVMDDARRCRSGRAGSRCGRRRRSAAARAWAPASRTVSARCQAGASCPAGPGRSLCELLQTSYCQSRHFAVAAEPRAHRGHHHRAIGLPCVLVLAHPLHAHRPAGQGHSEQCGVGAGVIRAVVAVAARALHMDAAHALGRRARQTRDRGAQRIDALAVRPDRHHVVLVTAHRA